MSATPIRHDPASATFSIELGGHSSHLEYELKGKEVVFSHTFVPPALRGHGLAAQLVEAGLQWAEIEGLRVVPACSYVAIYIQRHPHWQSLLR